MKRQGRLAEIRAIERKKDEKKTGAEANRGNREGEE